MNRRTFTSLLFASLTLALAAPSAWAEFRVCNSTGADLNIAYSVYYSRGDTRKYESRGWHVLADKECRDVDRFGNRRVWLLGMARDGAMWQGSTADTAARTFCQKSRESFLFDDGVDADVHDSAVVCERNGGTLKKFREFFGQANPYTIEFMPGSAPPARGGDRPDRPALPPSKKTPPIWESYPDEPQKKPSLRAPAPTFAPD